MKLLKWIDIVHSPEKHEAVNRMVIVRNPEKLETVEVDEYSSLTGEA
jgi:hypothetical protein